MEGQSMKELFLPYNLSLALKEIGFDEPCIGYFRYNKEPWVEHSHTEGWKRNSDFKLECYKHISDLAAPLYDQVIKWFIEKHRLWVEGKLQGKDDQGNIFYLFTISKEYGQKRFHSKAEWNFPSHKEALNAGIEKAIELIKQKK